MNSVHEMPCTPSTAPLDVQLDVSVDVWLADRRVASVANALEFFASDLAVDADRAKRLFERHRPGEHQAAEHVGLEARALLVGEEGDLRDLAVYRVLAGAATEAGTRISAAESTADEIVKNARAEAMSEKSTLLAAAEERAAQVAKDAEARAKEDAERVKRESEKDIARLAVLAAEKVLSNSASAKAAARQA